VRVSPEKSKAGTQFGERGIEADNNEFDNNATQCSGRSNMVVANFTLVGDKRVGANYPGATQGAELRRGTGYTILNSIVTNFKSNGIRVSDDASWQAHCVANPTGPAVFCPGALGVNPISAGNVFVASSMPNPVRKNVTISFSLPKAGPVSVEVYSADGRHVATLAKGDMPAGPQRVTWTLGKDTPSGMYFYRVIAGDQTTTGKIVRVD
jgi:Secretion system C-terminal sorting domain